MTNYYAVIDQKSFFASCECVIRGLDPFKTNLVVADPSRGGGAICLVRTKIPFDDIWDISDNNPLI